MNASSDRQCWEEQGAPEHCRPQIVPEAEAERTIEREIAVHWIGRFCIRTDACSSQYAKEMRLSRTAKAPHPRRPDGSRHSSTALAPISYMSSGTQVIPATAKSCSNIFWIAERPSTERCFAGRCRASSRYSSATATASRLLKRLIHSSTISRGFIGMFLRRVGSSEHALKCDSLTATRSTQERLVSVQERWSRTPLQDTLARAL